MLLILVNDNGFEQGIINPVHEARHVAMNVLLQVESINDRLLLGHERHQTDFNLGVVRDDKLATESRPDGITHVRNHPLYPARFRVIHVFNGERARKPGQLGGYHPKVLYFRPVRHELEQPFLPNLEVGKR